MVNQSESDLLRKKVAYSNIQLRYNIIWRSRRKIQDNIIKIQLCVLGIGFKLSRYKSITFFYLFNIAKAGTVKGRRSTGH